MVRTLSDLEKYITIRKFYNFLQTLSPGKLLKTKNQPMYIFFFNTLLYNIVIANNELYACPKFDFYTSKSSE